MSLRTGLLSIADAARKLSGPDFADIRTNQLMIRTRTWSGTRLGDGTTTDVDLVIPARYPVRFLNEQEVKSAGGRYEIGDIVMDHITPSDGTVGFTPLQLKPRVTADNVEILYLIVGSHAGEYALLDLRTFRPFTYQLILRRKTTQP